MVVALAYREVLAPDIAIMVAPGGGWKPGPMKGMRGGAVPGTKGGGAATDLILRPPFVGASS
jgi:hypothetical protein